MAKACQHRVVEISEFMANQPEICERLRGNEVVHYELLFEPGR